MQPISPVLPGFNVPETKFAENQAEYQTLPAVRTADGLVLSRWETTEEERAALAAGTAWLFLYVWLTACPRCGDAQPLTPIAPEITTPQEIMQRAALQAQAGESAKGAPSNGKGHAPAESLLELETPDPEEVKIFAPPSDAAISEAFKKLWTAHIGQIGYRERRWKDFRALLKARGINV